MFTCREACRGPDNLNQLASSLVERLIPDQENMTARSPSGTELGNDLN
jgi:hypothetical protein